MAHFAFALNSFGVPVSIDGVRGSERYNGFTCPDCSSPLIPNLKDDIKERHFRHASGYPAALGEVSECNGETDIHLRLKYAFAAALQRARTSGEPFNSALQQRHTCRLGCCEAPPSWMNTDLAAYDEVKIEYRVNSFIPDCYLTDSTGRQLPIFLEIFVTSRVSKEKIASKTAILELTSGYARGRECLSAINSLALPHELAEWYNHDLPPLTDIECKHSISQPAVATPDEGASGSHHRMPVHERTGVMLSPPQSYIGAAARGRSLLVFTWFPWNDSRVLWDTAEHCYLVVQHDFEHGRFANHGAAYEFCCSLKAHLQDQLKKPSAAELNLSMDF